MCRGLQKARRLADSWAMRDPSDTPLDPARLRPRFSFELPVPADEAILRLREGLDAPDTGGQSMAAGRHIEFLVDRADRRIWSPRLAVRVDDSPPGSVALARFSPRPDIWTGFMFVYFVMVFAVVFGATFGYVQQVSGERPWGYWGVPLGLLVIGGIHLAGYVGQRLAADQMLELRGRLDAILERQLGIRRTDAESGTS